MSMDKMFAKWGGGEVLKKAVRGMLPKNRLRDKRLARLKGNGAITFICQSNADSSFGYSFRRIGTPI